ncbi:MAG: BON domain-containing protein [Lysobacterales bacterium]|jgi:hyperosmotically inducible periplasmic protein|nr:MAG: BON domain-containing protein [Xanthomonadales bacterium]
MFRHIAAALMIVSLAAPAVAGAADRTEMRLLDEVAKKVNTYAWFTVFDDVSASLDNGVVTLTGKVTMPYKRNEIAKRVAKVDGIREVHNKIEVLPVSQMDDDLRYRIARAIYSHPAFWHYATMIDPPIHIVVDRGHVTLTGVVNSEVDRMIARSLASQFLAFSVKSEIKTTAEARQAFEGV